MICKVDKRFVNIRLAQLEMTQKELAAKCGLTPVAVSNILRSGNATVTSLGKLAAGLQCDPRDLLHTEGYPSPLVGAQAVYA